MLLKQMAEEVTDNILNQYNNARMSHGYNTRMNASKDCKKDSDEEIPMESGKITGYLCPLEIKFEKEATNKKAKTQGHLKQEIDNTNMNSTEELEISLETGVSSTSKCKERSRRVRQLSRYPQKD